MCACRLYSFFFFFNDTATTEIYTLSLTRRSSDLAGIRVAALSEPRCLGAGRAVLHYSAVRDHHRFGAVLFVFLFPPTVGGFHVFVGGDWELRGRFARICKNDPRHHALPGDRSSLFGP